MAEPESKFGLVDSSLLEKIDKLFACNAGSYVDLPQLVVVGNQSSGKSSVLAALTGLPFPRDSGLCTRFATQIIFRRAPTSATRVSIIPSKDGSSEHQRQMQEWSRETTKDFDATYFAGIMAEAAETMGIGQATGGISSAFSKDVFVIEITGPNQEHFSIIDVPGTFRRTTDGVTTKDDIILVDNMVHGYMANPRSVMLTVVPCNVDIANQDIIEKAQDLDPEGDRTFGVLTKPDLMDRGAEGAVVDLVEGKHHKLKLGWHVLRNPGQATLDKELGSRSQVEAEFFATEAPWNTLPKDHVGISALKTRLQEILASHIRREFPRVKGDLSERLRQAKKRYVALGPKRQNEMEQRRFVTEIASEIQAIVSMALRADYGRNSFFDENKMLRLATAVTARGQLFADEMDTFGHDLEFDEESNTTQVANASEKQGNSPITTRHIDAHPDIEDMLPETAEMSRPQASGMIEWLTSVYNDHKGFELGTLPSSLLSTTMRHQASRWEVLASGYVSDIITLVYRFMNKLIDFIILGNAKVCEAIKDLLSDHFRETYEAAAQHTAFLLKQELEGVPATYSKRFDNGLSLRRKERSQKEATDKTKDYAEDLKRADLTELLQGLDVVGSSERRVQDIHDILRTYYEVALDRFIDNMRMQVADNFLVTGDRSPLTLFSPAFVAGLTKEQLEDMAGEEASVKRQRAELEREVQRLEEGKKILR